MLLFKFLYFFLVLAFGLLPSVVFAWFVTNVSGLCVHPIIAVRTQMMGGTHDPKMLVTNQAKTMLGNNPKAKTKYCNPSRSLKSHILYFS
jgi:hypothetical protein